MPFNIAVDVFQKMIQWANDKLAIPITNRVRNSINAFQYADDTALIVKADVEVLVTVKVILCLFSKISGLHMNFEKKFLCAY